eukprot:TRINITY_DN5020_c0_g1_i1.p1 TRINITY_DN5020_c0_g1~~TRINITY_DN5020_c0_g1_i1.p1  ORF type:complete len:390 (+),score=106.49 TRINITY_DN5020_c0_g1_i1:47-1171(+)
MFGRKRVSKEELKNFELPNTMKALCFVEPGVLEIRHKLVPTPGHAEALVKVTCTTICGSDVHLWKGRVPTTPGITLGHEVVGVVVAKGSTVTSVDVGDRVISGSCTPCGCCSTCQNGATSECGGENMGALKLGKKLDGTQAEYVIIPNADYNLAKIPPNLTDTQVLMCVDVMTSGFAGAEVASVKIGDSVAIFGLGPVGLSSVVACRLMGATKIFGVDSVPRRLQLAKQLGCDHVIDFKETDPVEDIIGLNNDVGVDVAIEAFGGQETFQNCIKVLRPGGKLGNLGIYSKEINIPLEAYGFGVGEKQILSTLCPGGKQRMRRLMNVVSSGRADLSCLITHKFHLDDIQKAYDLFSNQEDGVIKVAIFTGDKPTK